MEIRIYKTEYKSEWDEFVRISKNGTFLFYRDFMEYHSNRFRDHSLMFYSEKGLIGIIPGHIEDQIYYTHRGLTYGGLLMSSKTTATEVLAILEHLTITLRNQGVKKIIYKAIPHIYHQQPAEEDLYAIFHYKGILIERNISSAILLPNKPQYSQLRKRGLKKATGLGLRTSISNDLKTFWNILSINLREKYNTTPTHSLEEITYLKEKFSNEIQLLTVLNPNDDTIAGCLFFNMNNIIHVQYIAGTPDAKRHGAIDMLIDHIINVICKGKTYFDYGISTENKGLYLNENLIAQKEGFGARAVVYDTYLIDLQNN